MSTRQNYLLIFASLFFLSTSTGCSGLPRTTTFSLKEDLGYQLRAVNLILDKSPELETVTPEVIKRIEALFKKGLAENNIILQVESITSLKVNLKQYDDGDVAKRELTGFLLGISIGELAKIEAEVTVISGEEGKIIKKATVLVTSSRSGFNFLYGYGGAEKLEKPFTEEVINILEKP
ncbi:MAG: hypothetical protein H8E80_07600 [Desulfobacteraceae bacterium]|uniref:Lipoprotein n=1 Tax=Candidatus Desulfaltia bathyphila TaxID=2841697 RepID=A0A8J6TAU0_9BACT|nr:hypothetical protein [Candidatus Desulfaltia bathyphila]MBL7196400.1 hypothetical protein [Desulfobacterales bacterium]